MTTDESLISKQLILNFPPDVVTSASSPFATVRLLIMASRAPGGPVMALSSNMDEEICGAAVMTVLIRVEFGKNGALTFRPATVNTDLGMSGSGGTVGRGAGPAPRAS